MEIKLILPDWDTDTWIKIGAGAYLFLSYFLFGPILSRKCQREFKKWDYRSAWPPPELAYALAPFSVPATLIFLLLYGIFTLFEPFFNWLIYGPKEKK